MKNSWYQRELGYTLAFSLRLAGMVTTNNDDDYGDGGDWLSVKRIIVIGDAWFSLVNTAVEIAKEGTNELYYF